MAKTKKPKYFKKDVKINSDDYEELDKKINRNNKINSILK